MENIQDELADLALQEIATIWKVNQARSIRRDDGSIGGRGILGTVSAWPRKRVFCCVPMICVFTPERSSLHRHGPIEPEAVEDRYDAWGCFPNQTSPANALTTSGVPRKQVVSSEQLPTNQRCTDDA